MCCDMLEVALDAHVVLPSYDFPDEETIRKRAPIFTNPEGRAAKARPGMRLTFCPFCGKKLDDPVWARSTPGAH